MPNRFRPKLTNRIILWMMAWVTIVFWVTDYFTAPRGLNDLIDGPLMVIAFIVAISYSVGLVRDFSEKTSQAYVMQFGIMLAWFTTGVWRVSRFLYAEGFFGKASILPNNDSWRGYILALALLAGVLHVVAIGMDDEGTFSRSSIYLCLAAMVGGVAAVVLFKAAMGHLSLASV